MFNFLPLIKYGPRRVPSQSPRCAFSLSDGFSSGENLSETKFVPR